MGEPDSRFCSGVRTDMINDRNHPACGWTPMDSVTHDQGPPGRNESTVGSEPVSLLVREPSTASLLNLPSLASRLLLDRDQV